MKKNFRITDLSVAAINRKMADLEESFRGVPDTRHVTTMTPDGAPIFTAGTADDPISVTHKWGKVPTSFTWTAGGDCRVYATGEDRAKWSKDVIVVRGTTPSTQIELTLLAHEDGTTGGPTFHGTTTAPAPAAAGSADKLNCATGGTVAVTGPTVARIYTGPDANATLLYAGGPLGTPSSGNASFLTSFPVLNQDTTGKAAKLAAVTGGTSALTGPTTDRVFTMPDADATVLYSGGALGTPSSGEAINLTNFPTLNQNTSGSAAKWTTARNLAGNSVDGSANVAFANKFIVQGTADAGLSGAQFLGALATGIVKNTTTTGVLSIAAAGDFPTLNQDTTGSAGKLKATLSAGNLTVTGPSVDRLMTTPDAAFSVARKDASETWTVGAGGGLTVSGSASPFVYVTSTDASAGTLYLDSTAGYWAVYPTGTSLAFDDGVTARVTFAATTGAITAGPYNKVTITAPATASTLTIADGKTLAVNNTQTIGGNDNKTLTMGGNFGVAWAKYSFATNGGAVSTITPGAGFNTTIPDNSIITAVTVNVTTAVTSGGSATVSIGTSAGSSATSLLAATAKASLTLDALINGVPTFAVPIKMTAAGSITFTIGTAALTAGVIEVFVQYYTAAA